MTGSTGESKRKISASLHRGFNVSDQRKYGIEPTTRYRRNKARGTLDQESAGTATAFRCPSRYIGNCFATAGQHTPLGCKVGRVVYESSATFM